MSEIYSSYNPDSERSKKDADAMGIPYGWLSYDEAGNPQYCGDPDPVQIDMEVWGSLFENSSNDEDIYR